MKYITLSIFGKYLPIMGWRKPLWNIKLSRDMFSPFFKNIFILLAYIFLMMTGCVNEPTTIHFAASEGNTKLIRRLLDDNPEQIHLKGKFDKLPLHYAAGNGRKSVVELLIDRKADVDARDRGELTPLHHAAQAGKKKTTKILIERGAKINARDNSKMTPLHKAAICGHIDVVEMLVSKKADINARDYSGKNTALLCNAKRTKRRRKTFTSAWRNTVIS